MKKFVSALCFVGLMVSQSFSASYSGTVVSVFYSVKKTPQYSDNYLVCDLKEPQGAIRQFAIPVSGGTFSAAPVVYFTDQESNRLLTLLLTAKSTLQQVVISTSVRNWTRSDGLATYSIPDDIELIP
jgi:hypothetical protein